MDRSSILIIDDDPGLRKTLVDILRIKGFEASTAANGAEALSLMKDFKFNLVLIDLGLPDMNGIDLLGRIKADQPEVEAIILTGNATLDSAIEATNSGAFSYLIKPYDIEQLLLQIRRAIEKQQAGEAVMRHQQELEKVNSELKTLYDISMALCKTIDMDELLGELLQTLSRMDVFKIEIKGALFLVEGGSLRMVSSVNFPDAALERCSNISSGECLCGMAEFKGETIYSPNTGKGVTAAICNPEVGGLGQITIPLKAAGKTVGVLSLYAGASEIDARMRDLIASMGNQIGYAVENAKIYQETKTCSLHDPLTGLANRRSMKIHLEKNFDMARRYAEKLSIVMADIDHFKKFNDTNGHLEGDQILVKVARILQQETRSSDFVFRYGGEEFLIILPKTDLTKASKVAEKLRSIIEVKTEITISLGVASFDKSMAGVEELIGLADAALYRAKQNGRNRVEAGG